MADELAGAVVVLTKCVPRGREKRYANDRERGVRDDAEQRDDGRRSKHGIGPQDRDQAVSRELVVTKVALDDVMKRVEFLAELPVVPLRRHHTCPVVNVIEKEPPE